MGVSRRRALWFPFRSSASALDRSVGPYRPAHRHCNSPLASCSMLCTRQNSRHWVPTLFNPRNVNRFSRLLCRRLPNTGSTVPIRWLYRLRPSGLSMRRFMACIASPGRSGYFLKMATCRTAVRCGCRRQRSLNSQGTQPLRVPMYR